MTGANSNDLQFYISTHILLIIMFRQQINHCRFEHIGQWLPLLIEAIVELGQKIISESSSVTSINSINSSNSNICFPLDILLQELEEISYMVSLVNSLSLNDDINTSNRVFEFSKYWVQRSNYCILLT